MFQHLNCIKFPSHWQMSIVVTVSVCHATCLAACSASYHRLWSVAANLNKSSAAPQTTETQLVEPIGGKYIPEITNVSMLTNMMFFMIFYLQKWTPHFRLKNVYPLMWYPQQQSVQGQGSQEVEPAKLAPSPSNLRGQSYLWELRDPCIKKKGWR